MGLSLAPVNVAMFHPQLPINTYVPVESVRVEPGRDSAMTDARLTEPLEAANCHGSVSHQHDDAQPSPETCRHAGSSTRRPPSRLWSAHRGTDLISVLALPAILLQPIAARRCDRPFCTRAKDGGEKRTAQRCALCASPSPCNG